METVQENEERVESYLIPRMARIRFLVRTLTTDPRHPQGLRHPLENMTLAMLAGMMTGGSPRDAERQSQRLGLGRRGGTIGDTTIRSLLAMSDEQTWRAVLVRMVKDMRSRKQLRSDGLVLHWMAIDGKYETLDHHADGMAQKFVNDELQSIYWRLGVLRAVLISAAGRQAVGQWTIGPVDTTETDPEKIKFTGEITNLWPFVQWLREQYGDLAENFTLDAGLWSRELFAQFDEAGLGIFGQLKGNKPELHAEAERVLRIAQARRNADATSDWEPCHNGQIKRELHRVTTLDGWNGWRHLRQVIMVKQTTRRRDGKPDDVELRYFATNLPTATMTPKQLLLLVRRHWAIENDCNWSFDMVMGEDDGTWCTQRKAVLALGVLRMIAYNLMQWLRKSHVRVKHKHVADTPRPWRELHELILSVWVRVGAGLLARLQPTPSG
jgi:predicted transposase YbfD/YdcC